MREKYLNVPLSERDVRELEIGEVVYLNGPVYTGRSLFHIRAVEQGIVPPVDPEKMNVLVHAGPMMEKVGDGWRPISMTLTASIRFDKYGPAIIKKLGIRAMIGKTTMGHETMETMREYGAVHLTAVGVMTNILPAQVRKVMGVYFMEELGGTEATWIMELEKAGPFIVDIDTKGNNLFQQLHREVEKRFKILYRRFGVPRGFRYTDVI